MRVVCTMPFWHRPSGRYIRRGEVFDNTDPVVVETPAAWWRSDDEQATARPGERRNTKRPKA